MIRLRLRGPQGGGGGDGKVKKLRTDTICLERKGGSFLWFLTVDLLFEIFC